MCLRLIEPQAKETRFLDDFFLVDGLVSSRHNVCDLPCSDNNKKGKIKSVL